MSSENIFPSLAGFEPTRQTLHRYSNILGVVPRAHGKAHPKWWHISLKMEPDGLATDKMALPGGGNFVLKMDLRRHDIVLATSSGEEQRWSMADGKTANELGDQVLGAVADLGLRGDEYIEIDELKPLKQRVGEFLLSKNPVRVDGRSLDPILDRSNFIKFTFGGF